MNDHEQSKKRVQTLAVTCEEKSNLGDMVIDGRIIQKRIWEKVRLRNGFIWHNSWPSVNCETNRQL